MLKFVRRALTPPLTWRMRAHREDARGVAFLMREDLPEPKPSLDQCERIVLRLKERDLRGQVAA
jgi:hypothetical protein